MKSLLLLLPAMLLMPFSHVSAQDRQAQLETTPDAAAGQVPPIRYEIERLENGLTVIYAPMENAPVVHVRVLYHVGSKDETPDRQGFAHMFEHMMFRGSEHVPAERHMELINGVGGNSNAFTSFDQTTYINTVPSNALEMALWLEADRMASFKVDEETFITERNVVNEEYLQRVVAPPYGRMFMDFFALAYEDHHYRWTPIGDMEHLRQAEVSELQEFFDTFYVPNNAVLTIAGQFDVDEVRQWVRQYYQWIPGGDEISRRSPSEPDQTQKRHKVVHAPNIPLPRLIMGYKTTTWEDEDQEVLAVLATILGQGRSSRLYQALVGGTDAIASQATAGAQRLEDTSMFLITIGLLPGHDPDEAERRALAEVQRIAEGGVSADELAKARTQLRLSLLNQRQTADNVAGALAEAQAFGGDAELVNKAIDRLESITAEDVERVARKYLREERLTVLQYRPERDRAAPPQPQEDLQREAGQGAPPPPPAGPTGQQASLPTTVNFTSEAEDESLQFPPDYPRQPPLPREVVDAEFDMGQVSEVGPVQVIVIHDDRLPLVGMTLLLPGGGDSVPKGKEGLASLAAELLARGAGGRSAAEWSEFLESRGISLNVSDGGDHTRVSGSFPADQLDTAADLLRTMLREPSFAEEEFRNLKFRSLAGLRQALSNPGPVAGREMNHALFGDSPDGRSADIASITSITVHDIRDWYNAVYNPPGASLIIAGDLTQEQGQHFARTLTHEIDPGHRVPPADYSLDDYQRRIIVVDNRAGGQSAVRIGGRAFTIDSDEKYAGSVATEILSSGLESRLNRVLRVEKGLTYGASGRFNASRHTGSFQVGFSTRPDTTGEAVRSTFEVLERMANEPVTDEELAEAKRRVTGSLVMSTQTVGQQASLRANIVLNDYPLDYYDRYAENITAVTKEDVQRVMSEYADPSTLTVLVVGPAETVVPQLEALGQVEVIPMPLEREPGE